MKWLGQEGWLINKRTEGQWLAVLCRRRKLVGGRNGSDRLYNGNMGGVRTDRAMALNKLSRRYY